MFWNLLGAVQAIPATLLCVAALIAAAVAVVVDTVSLVDGAEGGRGQRGVSTKPLSQKIDGEEDEDGHSLACPSPVVAVEVVKETLWPIAGLVALAVVEDVPALRVVAFGPGVDGQGAVAIVPLAGVGVALLVADTIFGFAVAVSQRTHRFRLHRQLAAFACPAVGALAAEVGEARVLGADAAVAARLGGAAVGAAKLAVGPGEAWVAGAEWATRSQHAAAPIVAGQLPARQWAALAVKPCVALGMDMTGTSSEIRVEVDQSNMLKRVS